MHPIHGFSADLNSSLIIFSTTLLHLPVSTTHVVSGSIMGVGSAERVKAVHWDVARQMVMAWVMTIFPILYISQEKELPKHWTALFRIF